MDATTKSEIAAMVANMMQNHQADLLKTAANTALAIVDKRISQNTSELKDTIDAEVAGCSTDNVFKNNINKSNFNFCQQIRDIWKKTDRAIDEGQHTKAKEYVQEGKHLTTKRIEVLRNYRSSHRFKHADSKTCWSCGRLGHVSPTCPYTGRTYYKWCDAYFHRTDC